MKLRLFILAMLLTSACAGHQKQVVTPPTITSEIHFGFARDQIKPAEVENLNESITFLKNYPQKMVIVEGHTDPIGTSSFNLELGDRRAREVKHFLIMQGVSPAQILVVSYGEDVIKDEHNYALNRRAVIRLTNEVIHEK